MCQLLFLESCYIIPLFRRSPLCRFCIVETFSEYLENIFVKHMFPTDDEIIEPPQLGELLAFIAVLTVLIYFSVLSGYLVKLMVGSCSLYTIITC